MNCKGLKYWLLFIAALVTSNLFGQSVRVEKKMHLKGKADNFYWHTNGQDLFVAENGVLDLYNAASGNFIRTIDTLRFRRFPLLDGKMYVKQASDSIALIDLERKESRLIRFTQFRAFYIAWDSASQLLALSHLQSSNNICIIDKDNNTRTLEIAGSAGFFIDKLRLSPGGKIIAVETVDSNFNAYNTLVYDTRSFQKLATIDADYAYNVEFGNAGNTLWVTDAWGGIHPYDADSVLENNYINFSEDDNSYHDGIEKIRVIHFYEEEKNLMTFSESGFVSFWKRDNSAKIISIPLPIRNPTVLQVSRSGQSAMIACKDSTIALLRIENKPGAADENEINLTLQTKHAGRISTIINDPLNDQVYTNDNYESAGDLKIWDRSTLQQIKTIEHFNLVGVSADHRYIIGSSGIIDAQSLENVTPVYFARLNFTQIVDYNTTARSLLVYRDDSLKTIDFTTGATIQNILSYNADIKNLRSKNEGNVRDFAINHQKNLIAAAINYSNGTCGSWEIVVSSLVDGSKISVLQGLDKDNECIRQLVFNPVFPYLLSRTSSAITIWNYLSGKKIKEIQETIPESTTSDDVYSACFSRDGKVLLLGYVSGRIARWRMEPLEKIIDMPFGKWKIISGLSFIDDHSVVVASEGNLFLVDAEKGIEIAGFGTSQKIHKVEKLLIDKKKDIIYSLQDEKVTAWNFHSLVNFKRADFSKKLPPYIWDISFSNHESKLVCTDYFVNPNVYDLSNGVASKGYKMEAAGGVELNGIKSLQAGDGKIIVLAENGLKHLHTLLIYDNTGKLIRNMWDSLRFYATASPVFLANPSNDSLYLSIKPSANSSKSALVAISLENYKSNLVYESGSSIQHCFFLSRDSVVIVDLKLRIMTVTNRKIILESGINTMRYVDYDPDSRRLFTASAHRIEVWHIPGGNSREPIYCVQEAYAGPGNIRSICFSAKRNVLFAGYEDASIKVFDGVRFKNVLTVYNIDSANYIIKNFNGFYYSTRKAAPDYISYRRNKRSYCFAQFDGFLNRPDILAGELWDVDPAEKSMLTGMYTKRLELKRIFPLPPPGENIAALTVNDRFTLPSVIYATSLNFSVTLEGKGFYELLVADNGSTILHIPLDEKEETAIIPIGVSLNNGMNRIKMYARKPDGTISTIRELSITCNPPVPVEGKTYFFGIGVNHYDNKPDKNLTASLKDMEDLSRLVQSKIPGAYCRVIGDREATRENILRIKQVLLTTGPEDKVIIAFSGHGLLDNKNDFYFGTHDISFSNPSGRGLIYDSIIGLFEGIGARKKLLLLDACNSGEVEKAGVAKGGSVDKLLQAAKQRSGIGNNDGGTFAMTDLEVMKNLFTDLSVSNGIVAISASQGYGAAEENVGRDNGTFTASVLACLTGASKLPSLQEHLSGKSSGITVGQLKDFVIQQVPLLTNNRQLPTSRTENLEYDWVLW